MDEFYRQILPQVENEKKKIVAISWIVAIGVTLSYVGFLWWDKNVTWWKFLPPVIGGFWPEGAVKFADKGYYNVDTEIIKSLFEYQLQMRLGVRPTWIDTIQNTK